MAGRAAARVLPFHDGLHRHVADLALLDKTFRPAIDAEFDTAGINGDGVLQGEEIDRKRRGRRSLGADRLGSVSEMGAVESGTLGERGHFMGLAEEIAAMRGGSGHSGRLLGEFRRTALLVPLSEGDGGGLMSGWQGGVRWIYAFTDEEALARFAVARDTGGREWEYLSILGARLVDAVIPTIEGPTGVAVDVADEDGSMLFPPVVGIVPDAQAVDADADRTDAA